MEKTNSLPRGLRNNNPLNLRISNNTWLGKVKNNTDGAFEQFITLEYGLRAAMRNIKTIIDRRKKLKQRTTIANLIHIWAPASDNNNEQAYCAAIEKYTTFKPTYVIDIKNKNHFCMLIHAMVRVENGVPVDFVRIENAYALAFNGIGFN